MGGETLPFQAPVCSTKNNEDGEFIIGSDGVCGEDCLTHEESLTWRKDKTFKMSLQYYNAALWTGLDLYGNLLVSLFIAGLTLTTLLSTFGKKLNSNFNCDNIDVI